MPSHPPSPHRQSRAVHRILRSSAVAAVVGATWCNTAPAMDVSAPVILQYFESTYGSMETRMPDVFATGYGSIYAPPPGRADQGDFSVGYDQYDRFDLGRPGKATLYGTETGMRATINATHRAGLSYGVDLVWNHAGFSNLNHPGFYDA